MAALPDVLDAGDVSLHRWRARDVDELLHAVRLSFEDLRSWMPWAQTMPTRKEQRAVLAEGERRFEQGSDFGFILRDRAGEVVGGCGLHRRVGPRAIEVGYWVRSDRHNQGLATATARCLTEAAFRYLPDVNLVEIHTDAGNLASTRVAEKLGFVLDREEEHEIAAASHTGRFLIWVMKRRRWRAAARASHA